MVHESTIESISRERDEARNKIEMLCNALEYEQSEAKELSKQIAALRDATVAVLNVPDEEDKYEDVAMCELEKVVNDTAEVAKMWVKVPKGWQVKPIIPTMKMLGVGGRIPSIDDIHVGRNTARQVYDAMNGAAPSIEEKEDEIIQNISDRES